LSDQHLDNAGCWLILTAVVSRLKFTVKLPIAQFKYKFDTLLDIPETEIGQAA